MIRLPMSIKLLGGAACVAAVAAISAWNWRLHSQSGVRLARAAELEERARALRAGAATDARTIRSLGAGLQQASNRIAEVQGLLEAEKRTHDPLRLQIEKMSAEQIALRDALARKDKSLEELEGAFGATRKSGEELRVRNDELRTRVSKLEADLKSAGERETTVRAQLSETQTASSGTKTKLDEVQRKLDEALRRAEEAERQVAEMRKQKPATDTPAPSASAP